MELSVEVDDVSNVITKKDGTQLMYIKNKIIGGDYYHIISKEKNTLILKWLTHYNGKYDDKVLTEMSDKIYFGATVQPYSLEDIKEVDSIAYKPPKNCVGDDCDALRLSVFKVSGVITQYI
jgi:argonaute-like protein implicated in RNA metabolism and viral defense